MRIDIDGLQHLHDTYRRAAGEQSVVGDRLKQLESALSGHVLFGSPPRSGRFDSVPAPLRVYESLHTLRQTSFRVSFELGRAYGKIAAAANGQIADLLRQAEPKGFREPYAWQRWLDAGLTSRAGRALGSGVGLVTRAVVLRTVTATPAAAAPLPGAPTIADLYRRLSTLRPGQVEVVPVRSGGGGVRYVVLIRGVAAGSKTPNSLGDAVVGSRQTHSAHSMGVLRAMKKAGIPRGAEVMLVGHSQGGITAANLAANRQANNLASPEGLFRITHVLAAGSPIGNKRKPAGTAVLALENTADVVPYLDGLREPSRMGRSVYRFRNDRSGLLTAHELGTGYLNEMSAERFTTDPRVERFVSSARDYLAGTPEPPRRFDLRYGPDPVWHGHAGPALAR